MAVGRLALTCLAANLALGICSAPAKDCGLKLLGSAELSVVHGGSVQVQVTVNERPAIMYLNTAGVVSAIMSSYLADFGLRARTANRTFISKDIEMKQFAIVRSFAMGSRKLEEVPFFLFPDEGPSSFSTRPDLGWIGMNLLWGSDFELDFARNKLNFYSTKHCSGGVVYWTEKYSTAPLTRTPMGNLIFPVTLDGKNLEATISTMSGRTAIRSDAARRLYGSDEPDRNMTLSGLGLSNASVQVALIEQPPPASCDLTSRRTGAFYYLGDECKGIEAPLDLGLDVVRHLHLYFATNEQFVYFSEADASK